MSPNTMTKGQIVYRLSPSNAPKPNVRRRDGQPCDPVIVLDAASTLCKAKGRMTHEELFTAVYTRGGVAGDASDTDVRRYIETLLRRWHAAGWLAVTVPDGSPAPVRSPSGGRRRRESSPTADPAERQTDSTPPITSDAQDADVLQNIAADVAEIRRIVERFTKALSGLAPQRPRESTHDQE